jgi:hypothetical protein
MAARTGILIAAAVINIMVVVNVCRGPRKILRKPMG